MSEPEADHLEAVVAALSASGNPRATPFQPSQGGWWCSMTLPLDGATARDEVARDARLVYVEDDDQIWCGHCWTSIFGADHVAKAEAAWVRARTHRDQQVQEHGPV